MYNEEQNNYHENNVPYNPIKKHSGLGITSFIIGVIGIFWNTFLVIWATISYASLESMYGEYIPEYAYEDDASIVILGLFIILSMLISFVSIILSLFGLVQNRKKLFSILGLVLNILHIFGFIFLIILGNI